MPSRITPGTPQFRADMDIAARMLEAQFKLPNGILSAMMQHESQYDPNAVSADGLDKGILQQRPIFVSDQAKRFKNNLDPFNPKQALYATASYLAFVYRITGRTAWDWPIIAYNWGEGSMQTFRAMLAQGVPVKLPRITVNYIRAVAPQYLRAFA